MPPRFRFRKFFVMQHFVFSIRRTHAARQPPSTANSIAIYDGIALGLFCAIFALMLVTFGDYGTTWDEDYHFWYGFKVLDYYRSFFHDTTALTSPPISYYGAIFDATAALLAPHSPFGYYTTRHLLNALVGIVGLIGCHKLARALGGPRVGLWAVILLLLTPNFYGPMFNNPKDVPFAAGYVWSLYYIVRLIPALPAPPWRDVVKLGLSIGLTLGVRVGGLLCLCYLGLVLAAVAALHARRDQRVSGAIGELIHETSRVVAPVIVLSYGIMLLAWPWAQLDPLWRPISAIMQFDHHDFPYATLFDGLYIPAPALPWTYLPTFLLIKLPELFLLLLGGGSIWTAWQVWREKPALETLLAPGLVVFAAVFPVVYAVAIHATLFDGMRHFLFVEPPLACCAALAFEAGIRRLRAWSKELIAVSAMLALYLGYHIAVMLALHPDEYVYYNALVGGVSGAAGRFKLDYWANSYREAVHDLVVWLKMRDGSRFDETIYHVAACGPPGSVMPYLPANLVYEADRKKADFYIAFTKDGCDRSIAGRKVAEVARLGVRLSVVLDLRPLAISQAHH
jgi:hypothetical protein